jgi:hypothetical protein
MGLTAALSGLSGAAALGAAWTWAVGLRSLSGLRAPAARAPVPQPGAE